MKAMLASDAVEGKLVFPCYVQPKIDGVRALNVLGTLTGRSLKLHKNKHVTAFFSHPAFLGFDGEMAADYECHAALCRLTSSALSTIEGTPWILWHVFDYLTPQTEGKGYEERRAAMIARVQDVAVEFPQQAQHLRIVPMYRCTTLKEVLQWDETFLTMGYEGTILRAPCGPHKEGRSTVREGGLLRIKRFVEAEGKVVAIIEGDANNNEAQINELGLQFRSSHQANKVPNGMVGAVMVELVEDVVNAGDVLFKRGQLVRVSAGSMPHADRLHYFQNQQLLMGEIIKLKTFPKGVKDKLRFPTFVCLRSAEDMG